MSNRRHFIREEYIMEAFTKVGLDALLTPNNCLLVLIRRTQISSPILLISKSAFQK